MKTTIRNINYFDEEYYSSFTLNKTSKKFQKIGYEGMKSDILMKRASSQERLGLGVAIESNEADHR